MTLTMSSGKSRIATFVVIDLNAGRRSKQAHDSNTQPNRNSNSVMEYDQDLSKQTMATSTG